MKGIVHGVLNFLLTLFIGIFFYRFLGFEEAVITLLCAIIHLQMKDNHP